MDVRFLLESGGPLAWPLLGLSVLSCAALTERALFFAARGRRLLGPDPQKELRSLRAHAPVPREARRLRRTAGGRLLAQRAAVLRREAEVAQYDGAVRTELAALERKLGALDLVVCAAPLLGILGTVLGLVNGFGAMGAHSGAPDLAGMTGGVSQALATTILGLAVALGALVGRSVVGGWAERARDALLDYLERVEEAAGGAA